MPAITIDVDSQAVTNALTLLAQFPSHLRPAMDAVGAHMVASTHLNFRGQHSPDGQAWAPLSEATLANRRGGEGQILRDTGRLNRSITHNVLPDGVEIGSDVVYANMMQFGGKKTDFPWLWGDIPGRSYLGFSAGDEADVTAIIGNFWQRAAGL